MSKDDHTNELSHHGIPGMKWGVRRYQNADGSLTAAGKKRVAKMKDKYTKLTGKKLIRKPTPKNSKSSTQNEEDNKKKRIKDMSDVELNNKITRLQKEKQLMSLQAETGTKGERFVSTVGKQVIAPAAIDAGRRLLTDMFMKKGSKVLGLNEKETKDALSELRKEVDTLELNKRKAVAQDYLNKRQEKQNKSNESKKDEPKAEKVKAEFVKDKTSSNDSYKKKESVIIDADWKEVKSDSTELVPYKRNGESFVDDLFKKKK